MSSPLTIFLVFLRLGLTSFGGPIAHLSYFRAEFVSKRQWLSDAAYADIVALSQFVPGPASSQTGFALGIIRGGWAGGLAAWIGFTLPSAMIMLLAARGLSYSNSATAQGVLHGLKLLATAVVGQAVWSMSKSLCPDRPRAGFAFTVAAILIASPGNLTQLVAIAAGALFGLLALSQVVQDNHVPLNVSTSRGAAAGAIVLFFALFVALPFAAAGSDSGSLRLADAFYQVGALVFGGGHVVLPLLQETVVAPGWLSRDDFLAGYGAAQALPGPLFTFAAFLGAKSTMGPGGASGALIAVVAIFLPGLLLVYGALPFWDRLRTDTRIRSALNGVNAAVVGILGAALYQPVWTSAILGPADAALALLAFAALVIGRVPVLLVVASACVAGAVMATI